MMEFTNTLKTWRHARRFSQLQLAIEAGISARHLSFLESGRAKPSREMIGKLSDALQLPLEARNVMFTHAGFAARYAGRQWDDEQMQPIQKAIDRLLETHMPYPCLVLDRYWTILKANDAAAGFFGVLGAGVGVSILDLMMSDTLPPLVGNWPEVAHHTAMRLRTESLAFGGDEKLDAVVAHLSKVDGVTSQTAAPVIPITLRLGELRLSMFSTLSQFGTPEDVTLDSYKIEHYFPMDAQTEAFFNPS